MGSRRHNHLFNKTKRDKYFIVNNRYSDLLISFHGIRNTEYATFIKYIHNLIHRIPDIKHESKVDKKIKEIKTDGPCLIRYEEKLLIRYSLFKNMSKE